MALLERTQRLNGAQDQCRVLFEPRNAPILHRPRRAEVVDENLQVRGGAREPFDGLLVGDEVLAHKLQLGDNRLGQRLALLQKIELDFELS